MNLTFSTTACSKALLPEATEFARKAGFTGIELFRTWTESSPVHPDWSVPMVRDHLDETGLTLTGRVVRTGEQWVDQANTLELDSWTRFDLGARYVFAAGETPVTVRLSVDNVANERYWASAFDAFSPPLLQGGPRAVKASISADF